MKILLVSVVFLTFQSFCFARLDTDIALTNRVILSSSDWNPAPEDIQKCVLAIQEFLGHPDELDNYSKSDVKFILKRAKHYRVQFVGVIRDGKKAIWCNFFPAPRDGRDNFPDWKKWRVKVRDGGAWFWRIYYDPITHKCWDFESNGIA